MDEDMDFEDVVDDTDRPFDYEKHIGLQRQDVRRKIEERLERKRLRDEFGDLDDF